MDNLLKVRKFGLLAAIIVAIGAMGLIAPAVFHWNGLVHLFITAHQFILVPAALALLGLLLDKSKIVAAIALFASLLLYLSPRFIKVADILPYKSLAPTIVCIVDQTGKELDHITLNTGGKPMKLPKNKYWSKAAKFAPLPLTVTKDLVLSVDVGFKEGEPIQQEPIITERNGKLLRHLIVFIRPDRRVDSIAFY